jgi:hypothetical protein
MRVTPDGYGLITFFLLAIAEKVCQGRIAFIMEVHSKYWPVFNSM